MTTPAEILEPHRARKVRRVIMDDSDHAVCGALWSLIYGPVVVTHATALAVDAELCACTKTIGDVLDGWRPEALSAPTDTPRDADGRALTDDQIVDAMDRGELLS